MPGLPQPLTQEQMMELAAQQAPPSGVQNTPSGPVLAPPEQSLVPPTLDMSAALGGKVKSSTPMRMSAPLSGDTATLTNTMAAVADAKKVPNAPEVPSDYSFGNSFAEGAQTEDALDRYLLSSGVAQKPGAEVMDEGTNYLPVGGKEIWKDTFVTKPQQLEDAINAGAEAEGQLGQQRADFFKRTQERQQQELAVMKERQMQRQAELEARQAQLDSAVKSYSNDLADTGKFWHQPESIFSAIAAVLMTAGSPGDPSIGIRMMNQATEADWNKRKQLADMHLGELRSNVGQYRQLMGDKDLGDKMALAESNRVAAMELERIGNQFQGPIAKARAAAVSKELLKASQLQMMQVYQASIYNRAHMENPAIKASMSRTGKATGGEGYTPFGMPAVDGSTGEPKAAPVHQGGQSGGNINTALRAATGKPTVADQATKDLVNNRAPGNGQLLEMYRNQVAREAAVAAKGDPSKYAAEQLKIINSDKADADRIYKELSPEVGHVKASAGFRRDVRLVQASLESAGVNPNEWIGDTKLWTSPKWASLISNIRQRYGDNSPQSSAVDRFHQLFSGHVVEYYHQMGGGSLTPEEIGAFKQVIGTDSDWNRISGFADIMSKKSAATLNGKLGQGNPRVATRVQIRLGMDDPFSNTPGVSKTKK